MPIMDVFIIAKMGQRPPSHWYRIHVWLTGNASGKTGHYSVNFKNLSASYTNELWCGRWLDAGVLVQCVPCGGSGSQMHCGVGSKRHGRGISDSRLQVYGPPDLDTRAATANGRQQL